jgi:hypothetical protein
MLVIKKKMLYLLTNRLRAADSVFFFLLLLGPKTVHVRRFDKGPSEGRVLSGSVSGIVRASHCGIQPIAPATD